MCRSGILLLVAGSLPGQAFAAAPPQPPNVDQLIKELGSDGFREREAAARALEALGDAAVPALVRTATSGGDLEVRRRAQRLLKSHQGHLLNLITRLRGDWERDAKVPDHRDLHVTLAGKHVRDHHLLRLGGLLGLGKLSLHDTAVTDKGLSWVKMHPELRSLILDRSGVTDAGLIHLRDLRHLEELELESAAVKGAGLAHLKGLTNLKSLGLSDTPVTDAGLAHLAGLVNLVLLDLARTKVSDAGLGHLAGMSHLQTLHLANTRVTDAGLVHLEKVHSLRLLYLAGTQVTDTGLASLHGLTNLQKLDLSSTRVSEKGIAALRKAIPRLTIES